ncbi:hypothetical protein AZA_89182 [Nitrospirillum viridazoti Y2]|nr:hypothetical protein AZA_89182 [Nitrospirillum amazonense Y2]
MGRWQADIAVQVGRRHRIAVHIHARLIGDIGRRLMPHRPLAGGGVDGDGGTFRRTLLWRLPPGGTGRQHQQAGHHSSDPRHWLCPCLAGASAPTMGAILRITRALE